MDSEVRPTEIKDLNKTQLILLAILLSFVVSIATGIVTVTLMQQASPAVNQTINRVVSQTIERVVPDYTPGKVQTVVVKEDDLVVDAVKKTRAGLAEIFVDKDATNVLADAYSIGEGIFLAPSYIFDKTASYIVSFSGKTYDAKVLNSSSLGLIALYIEKPDTVVKQFPKASFGKDTDAKPGQTVALIGFDTIYKNIIQSVTQREEKDETGKVTTSWNIISISSALPFSVVGSYAVNLDGNVIGMVVPKGDDGTQILASGALEKFITDSKKLLPASYLTK